MHCFQVGLISFPVLKYHEQKLWQLDVAAQQLLWAGLVAEVVELVNNMEWCVCRYKKCVSRAASYCAQLIWMSPALLYYPYTTY